MSVPPPKERFKQFEKVACDFKIDRNIPIRRYFRSGVEMLRMADTYYNEDNHEKAYILYHKYVTLFVEKLKLHPEYKVVGKVEKSNVLKSVRVAMTRLEELKKLLSERFEREYAEFSAILEMKRAEMARMETEMKKKKLEEEGRRLREELNKYHDEKERALAIQRDREIAIWHQLQIDQELADEENAFRLAQLSLDDDDRPQNQNEPRPQFDRGLKPEAASSRLPPSAPPVPSRSSKPSSSLYTSPSGLRTVRVPSVLMAQFLSLAEPNTSANVETCGILAGKLQNNSFRITHLLIPKQKGTSDSCDTCGEEAIFEYQDSHDLITLGWIHTHPSQTAFLSSVDLHTQLSYQLMLPEAVAIVISPKFNETGFFVLTPNYGLDFIGNCRESGFHPHPNEPPLFEEGSHVELDEASDVIVADLR